MKTRRLFLVRGFDPFTGPVGDYFWAASRAAAESAFFGRFGLRALSVEGVR